MLKNSCDRYNWRQDRHDSQYWGVSRSVSAPIFPIRRRNLRRAMWICSGTRLFRQSYERPYNNDGSYRAVRPYLPQTRANGSYTVSSHFNGFNPCGRSMRLPPRVPAAETHADGQHDGQHHQDLRFVPGSLHFSYLRIIARISTARIHMRHGWTDRSENNATTSKRTYGSIYQTSTYNTNYLCCRAISPMDILGEIHQ